MSLPAAMILTILASAFLLQAEDKDTNFLGKFLFGYRIVDTSGTFEKYKEDINLDDGARLFTFHLQYTPNESFKKLLDRLNINLYNFGGDPYETFRLDIQKYGRYKFQYDHKKAAYFYADQYEAGGHLFDPFTFDFERTMDNVFFKFWFSKNIDLYLNYNSYTKKGNSTTSLDINRVEFEFDKPISEDFQEVALGLDIHVNRYSFLFEEKIMDYENSNSYFLPGFADGGPNARYPSTLNLYALDQPYNLKTYTHTLQFSLHPFDNLLIKGSGRISNQDMDLSYAEEADGINYLGKFFMYSLSGKGSFNRKIQLYQVDISYLLFDKLALVTGFRVNDFEQEGSMSVDDEREETIWNYDTRSIEAGIQYQYSPQLVMTLGYRNEVRELDTTETVTYEEQTIQNGLFGNIKWDLSQTFKITADYQYGAYENPYTLISPTNFHRFRFTAKATVKQIKFSGTYMWKSSESKVYDNLWNSTHHQVNVRAGYHTEKIQVSGGYSYMDVEQEGDRIVAYPPSFSGPAGTFLWEILYEGKSNLFDASMSFDLAKNWKLAGYTNIYWNRGFWEIDRITLKGYLEYTFDSGFITRMGYRFVDFEEKLSGFNDYSAHIIECSFGYIWK
jgi:hypothetical protein